MKFHQVIKTIAASALLTGTVIIAVAMPAAANPNHGIKAAIENPDRPAKDKARDEARKPVEVLAFSGVRQGMTVLDINAGGGFYTELLSAIVGHDGKVYSHNGPAYWNFMKQKTPERFNGGRLANVTHIHDGHETVDVPAGSVDLVMAVLAYHDYYYTNEARPGGRADVPKVLASIYKAMKPGASFVIVDHVANAGSGPDEFDKLHRMDPEVLKAQMAAAGFTLADESDMLANPKDDNTLWPFAPEVRGKTNRFVMRFTK
jgi:predicted methyltransferase